VDLHSVLWRTQVTGCFGWLAFYMVFKRIV